MTKNLLKAVRSRLVQFNISEETCEKISKKKPKYVDTVVNSIQLLPFPPTIKISNTRSNPKPEVDYFVTNLSKSSRADQDVVSGEIRYSYDCTRSYPTVSVAIKGINSRIVIIFYTDDLKVPSTPLNSSPSLVISGITPPFSLRIINQNDSSVKNSSQFQSSKMFPDNSINFEGINSMSTFDNNSLKKVTLKSTTTCQCSTSKTVK